MFELHVSVTGRPVTCAFGVRHVSVTCGASATTSTSASGARRHAVPLPHITVYVTVPAFSSTQLHVAGVFELDGAGQNAPVLPPDNVHGTTFAE